MVRDADGKLSGDITHYVYWTRLVTLGGIQSAYGGTWPETYAVYPPVTLYAYQARRHRVSLAAGSRFDPDAAQQSLWLREGIKFVALAWHLLTGAAIFWAAAPHGHARRRRASPAPRTWSTRPTLYDVAHWAQPDGAHSLFSVLAIGLLGLGQVIAPWAAIAVAALAKPQAWSILPLLAIATIRLHGLRGLGARDGGRRGRRPGRGRCRLWSPAGSTSCCRCRARSPRSCPSCPPTPTTSGGWFSSRAVRIRCSCQTRARAVGPLTYRTVAAALVGAVCC